MFNLPAYRSSESRKVQNGIRDPKITKWKCFYRAFVEALESFCTMSSFAPLRFAFKKKRQKLDVLLWISVTITLLVLSTSFIQDFYINYESMSTTTLVKTHQRSITSIPFPAITICPTSSFTYIKVYGFIKTFILKHPTLSTSINITKILKSFTLVDATQNDFEEMDIVLSVHNITMKDVYYYTAQNCDELLQRCRWQGEIRPCSQLFKKVFGGGNFCCSFNYPVPISVISDRNGLLKTTRFGKGNGLSVITKPIGDKFYYRSDFGSNIRIIVHHFFSFPLYNENDVFAPMRKETNLEIDSVFNAADPKVIQLPIKSRDCVFGWERDLQHFPTYSYSNCILDCRINKIIRACGCATCFLPSVNSSICPPTKLICNAMNQKLELTTNDEGTVTAINCDCPDDCDTLKLRYSVQATSFARTNFSVDEFYNGVTEDNGIIHINFSKSFTKFLERKLLLDEIQLASSVGGIFALFMGCSLISIFEIVYFLSIRLYANYRRLCIQNLLASAPM